MHSVLNYIGKKDIDLSKYNIDNYKVYCEPFSGSFNTGFELMETGFKGKIIYNDLDSELVNFWNILKESPTELYDNCNTLIKQIHSLITDDEKKNMLKHWKNSKSSIKQASAKYTELLFTTMSGLKFSKGIQSFAYLDFLILSDFLNENNIIIENLDYKECIQKYDSSETFFLIDPPYERNDNKKYYCLDYNNIKLSDLINVIDNVKADWLLTYSNSNVLKEHYKKLDIKEITRNMFGRKYKEVYIHKNN